MISRVFGVPGVRALPRIRISPTPEIRSRPCFIFSPALRVQPSPCVLYPQPLNRREDLNRGNPGVAPLWQRRKKALKARSSRFRVTWQLCAFRDAKAGSEARSKVRSRHCCANDTFSLRWVHAQMRCSRAALYSKPVPETHLEQSFGLSLVRVQLERDFSIDLFHVPIVS